MQCEDHEERLGFASLLICLVGCVRVSLSGCVVLGAVRRDFWKCAVFRLLTVSRCPAWLAVEDARLANCERIGCGD